MASAASLVELFAGPLDEPEFDLRTGGLPFVMWPLDRAFADGGWRVLALETSCRDRENDGDSVDIGRSLADLDTEAWV